ncbi:uncharacterized protein CCR75_007904 [Bremia lactucae]|uniref:Uncharacterized protein n=1 Tax=Bremia lactucae TaxID=4779 RepID=A0A976NYX2_BRELC|nr:hypothetical protein CCR75_007906 [Bremia lactucae]TDH73337.1 hypothetical protein CCR75_007904 [Bremia lactucae]
MARALAGETPHQIEERKKRIVERKERQEKRFEARLQHQMELSKEKKERRKLCHARNDRASRSPSPTRDGESIME